MNHITAQLELDKGNNEKYQVEEFWDSKVYVKNRIVAIY